MLDALVHLSVIDKDLTVAPGEPDAGARYIVGAGASGAWAGHDGHIAAYQDGAWMFFEPLEGWRAWVVDEGLLYAFEGGAWASILQNAPMIGVGTTADATNRLAVRSAASLFTHAGAGHQVKVNKQAAGDTASFLFQTNWSGRAEIGLAGSDTFAFKVSADGSSWYQALTFNPASGAAEFGGPVGFKQYAVADLPSPASVGSGVMVYVWDAPGGACNAFCDGGNWRRVKDDTVIS